MPFSWQFDLDLIVTGEGYAVLTKGAGETFVHQPFITRSRNSAPACSPSVGHNGRPGRTCKREKANKVGQILPV